MTKAVLASFAIGFLGSFHCMGMCGGLAASLSSTRKSVWWLGLSAYQLGRILTYTLLGMFTGIVGVVFSQITWFDQAQNLLAILTGTIMLVFGFHIAGLMPDPFARGLAGFYRITGLASWISAARNSHMPTSWFIVGMINGLLPCGLVYTGLSLSLTAAGISEAMLMMFAFGMGTVPAMMILPSLLSKVSQKGRYFSIKAVATLVICLGFLTMFRGSDWVNQHIHHHDSQQVATSHVHQD